MGRGIWGALLVVGLAAMPGQAGAAAHPVAPELSGTAYLPNGKPAARLTLQGAGWRQSYVGGQRRAQWWPEVITLRTDTRGRYRATFRPLPDASVPPEQIVESAADWSLTMLSSQGYADINLKAKAGQARVRKDLHLRRGDRISGVVIGYPGGRPLAGARASAGMLAGLTKNFTVTEAVTDAQGRFRLPVELPPGQYVVGATKTGYGLLQDFGSRPADSAKDYAITLHLVKDPVIRGQVSDADGLPVREQLVDLVLADPARQKSGTTRTVRTDGRGRFELRGWLDNEFDPWKQALRRIALRAQVGGRTSETVVVEAAQTSSAEVLLRVR